MNVLRRLLNRPLPPRVEIVQAALDEFSKPSYLEIGVHTGVLFLHLRARRKVGVDPDPRVPRWKRLVHPNTALRGRLVAETSDEYFAALDPGERFEVVFVDGLHLHEQCSRDIENALRHLSPRGTVFVHDCNPASALSAGRDPEATAGAGWCGDVWKSIASLRANRDDLSVETLDTDSGIGVVRRGANPGATAELSVDELTYEDLASRRAELLGLRVV
jgi:hypothetical protein